MGPGNKSAWPRIFVALFIIVVWYQIHTVNEVSKPNQIVNIHEQQDQQPVLQDEKSDQAIKQELPVLAEGLKWKNYAWEYKGKQYSIDLPTSQELFIFYSERERKRNYDLFASNSYDDVLIESIVEYLTAIGTTEGMKKEELPYFVVSFVQALPYTSDSVTTGYDEYPRFPYETLHEGGGDCEDTSILAAALLSEMGYGTALITLPGHMGVGIKCNETVSGSRYIYQGIEFCYLETTGENWPIGELPPQYHGKKAKIDLVYKKPYLDTNFKYTYKYDQKNTYVNVDIIVKNLGSEIAKDVKIYTALQTSNEEKIWDQLESEYITIKPEDVYTYSVTNLHAPSGNKFRVYVNVYGHGVIAEPIYGKWIVWTKK